MKVVIVDIEGKYAVALKKDGEFIKVRNNGKYKVGYEYDIEKNFSTGKVARIASIAAVFVLIVGMGAGVYSYNMPYSYVDLEINPSIEITANIFDRIINVKSLNDDGEQILPRNSIKNRVLQEGIDIILSNAVEHGYLKKDQENAIIITVSAKDSSKAGQLEESIEAVASEKLQSYSVKSEILIEETTVDKKQEAAEKYGITSGKMNLINKLLEKDPELKIDDLKDKPVKYIMESIKEFKNNEEDDDKKDEGKKNALNKSDKDSDNSSKDNKQVSSSIKGNIKGNSKSDNKGKDSNYNNKGNNKNNKDDDGKRDSIKNKKNNKDDDDNIGVSKSNKNNFDNRNSWGNNKSSKNNNGDNRNNWRDNKSSKDNDDNRNKVDKKSNKNNDDNKNNKNNKVNKDDDGNRGNNKNKKGSKNK